jgi:hypothetical protein
LIGRSADGVRKLMNCEVEVCADVRGSGSPVEQVQCPRHQIQRVAHQLLRIGRLLVHLAPMDVERCL